jgi:bifunctional non-homologous end joining protein LigD
MDLFKMAIRPMLAYNVDEPFDSEKYIFELKWDGTRTICFISDEIKLQNRRLIDFTFRYPEIKFQIRGEKAILDGEIVVMHQGKPDFSKLQMREHIIDPFKIEVLSKQMPAEYIVFDILYLNGKDLTKKSLAERKEILRNVVIENEYITICDYIYKEGVKYFKATVELGLEGIIAKRLDSPYLIGRRSKHWLKIKSIKTIDCIICGLTIGSGSRESYFGSLILGLYAGDELKYVGRAGSGLSEDELSFINKEAMRLAGSCPFKIPPPIEGVKIWLKPELICEVKYLEFTSDLKLRAPSFIRLRLDKSPMDCKIENEE